MLVVIYDDSRFSIKKIDTYVTIQIKTFIGILSYAKISRGDPCKI